MEFWRSIGGMVDMELTSAQPEALLEKLSRNGIELYALHFENELTCRFRIRRQDCRRAVRICRGSDDNLRMRSQMGLYWKARDLFRRPVLAAGFAGFLALVLFLPTRVLFLQVEGNTTVPANKILEEAQRCGIRFGASRREVSSEKVKNALIGAVPHLQWAGVNTKGCVAIISVKERALRPAEPEQHRVSSLVARTDGYILSATATRGNLLVQPGQAVRAGDVLISGYSDLGLCLRAEQAEGDVYAQTTHRLQAVTPAAWVQKQANGKSKKKISLLLGKNRINLWKDSGISGGTCGRMYEEYYITLPGNFRLPVGVCVETYMQYDCKENVSPQPQQNEAMEDYLKEYLHKQMIAGQIIQSTGEQCQENGAVVLKLDCICHEMIGRVRPEQLGDRNE